MQAARWYSKSRFTPHGRQLTRPMLPTSKKKFPADLKLKSARSGFPLSLTVALEAAVLGWCAGRGSALLPKSPSVLFLLLFKDPWYK